MLHQITRCGLVNPNLLRPDSIGNYQTQTAHKTSQKNMPRNSVGVPILAEKHKRRPAKGYKLMRYRQANFRLRFVHVSRVLQSANSPTPRQSKPPTLKKRKPGDEPGLLVFTACRDLRSTRRSPTPALRLCAGASVP